jgi:hypothetical protein
MAVLLGTSGAFGLARIGMGSCSFVAHFLRNELATLNLLDAGPAAAQSAAMRRFSLIRLICQPCIQKRGM